MPELKYWNVGLPQTERVNRESMQWLAKQNGYQSVGRFLVELTERYFNQALTEYQTFASNYTSSHKGESES